MAQDVPTTARDREAAKMNIFQRIMLFIRQVIAETRKAKWPSREEWYTYFLVVLVFVGAVMLFTGLLDLLFGQLSVWIFG